jgi:MFS family permease
MAQFPLLKVASIGLINGVNTASYLISLPFVGFMILGFYSDLTVNQVGYLSGVLEGSFHVGAFFGALFWAWISDTYGRRPAVLCGLAGSGVAALAFGLAPAFPLAVLARFAWVKKTHCATEDGHDVN